MKRLLSLFFVSFLLGLPLCTRAFAGDCTPHKIGGWFPESNEYLYPSINDHYNQNAYECQSSHCGDDDVVLVVDPHYLDGKRVNNAHSYRCQLGGDDKWVYAEIPECPKLDCKELLELLDDDRSHNYWRDGDGNFVKWGHKVIEKKTAHYKYSDLCTIRGDRKTECLKKEYDEFFLEAIKKQCEESGGKYNKPKEDRSSSKDDEWFRSLCSCPDGKTLQMEPLKCVASTPSHTPGDACDAGDLPQYATAGKWIASGHGGSITCAATACKNGTYLVVNASGASQGWCTAPIKCENGTMRIIDNTKTDRTCVDASGNQTAAAPVDDENGANVVAAATDASSDAGAPAPATPAPDTRNECEKNTPGYVVFEGACITTAEQQRIESERAAEKARERLTKQISDAAQELKSISDGFGQSRWKTADGNFNGARLASDSIAGVVLGTTGGLVTGKVIKKNQIKKGFENIKCVVGGQTVADFGDDFVVGQQ